MRKVAIIGTGFRNTGSDTPPQEILETAGPDYNPLLIETRMPVFPVNEINRKMCETSIIECGLRAADEGFEGIFINTVGDYGLEALRSGLKIPVVGAGQASMHTAAQLGRRFSIVTIWPPQLLFIYRGLLRLYEMENLCVSIRCASLDEELETLPHEENFVTEMRRGEITQEDRILRECALAVKEDRADSIILGCTCMSPIAKQIAAKFSAPVLNPMTTGYQTLESLLKLNLSHSEIEYPTLGEIGSQHYSAMADSILKLKSNDVYKTSVE